MSELPFTKKTLLDAMTAGRREFDEVLARIAPDQMETPVLHDGWSVKDMLGHVGYWEAEIVARFATLRAGGKPEPVTDLDSMNARALDDWRRLSVAETRKREREAYDGLLGIARDASTGELFDPGHFAEATQNPFALSIANNTWGHYAEHLPELTAWLDGGGRA